jgi:hypothetical protein
MKLDLSLLLFLCLWTLVCAESEEHTGGETEKKESLPELPNWEENELKELESGEYVPGSSLMGELARKSIEAKETEKILVPGETEGQPENENQAGSSGIAKIQTHEYLKTRPEEHLIDPQWLLNSQEASELKSKLERQSQEGIVDLYLYLFHGEQDLPEDLTLREVIKNQFDSSMPTAVVFYFVEAPERSELQFTEKVMEETEEAQRERVLWLPSQEAVDQPGAFTQLEFFTDQILERIKDLEKAMPMAAAQLSANGAFSGEMNSPEEESKSGWSSLSENQGVFWSIVGIGMTVFAGLLGFFGRWVASRRRSYLFPDAEGATLFEAPHAAGVGGVLSFSSAQTPPSRQESDVPDYLQRM